jgi:hypothetical protein
MHNLVAFVDLCHMQIQRAQEARLDLLGQAEKFSVSQHSCHRHCFHPMADTEMPAESSVACQEVEEALVQCRGTSCLGQISKSIQL